MNSQPTVFHITHPKAGSQWVAEILKHAAPDRVVLPKTRMAHFYEDPLCPGGVYLTVHVPRPDFDRIATGAGIERRLIVVIRDLRDTLVSLYFSLRYSHIMNTAYQRRARGVLAALNLEEGLLMLIGSGARLTEPTRFVLFAPNDTEARTDRMNPDEFSAYMSLKSCYYAYIQLSWLTAPDVFLVRYEELARDEQAVFAQMIRHCEIEIAPARLRQIVEGNSFAAVTGRHPGDEDVLAHQRKGIVGDWRNHFTPAVKATFKERFGEVLIRTGYEQDANW